MLFRPARASDLDEVCALLATAEGDAGHVRALLLADPGFDPGQFRLAWTGGRIVACAKVYPRLLRIGATTVDVGGIASLQTEPSFERQRLASTLLVECLTAMDQAGLALAIITAPPRTLYTRLGWHALTETTLHLPPDALNCGPEGVGDTGDTGDTGTLPSTTDAGTIAPLSMPDALCVRSIEERDLGGLLALHQRANRGRTGSVLHDADSLTDHLAVLYLRGMILRVAVEQTGAVVGFIAAQPLGKQVEVVELLLSSRTSGTWRALLCDVADAAPDAVIMRCGLPVDDRRVVRQALGRHVHVRERRDLLVRVVDPARLLRRLAAMLESRALRAGLLAELTIRFGSLQGGAALRLHGASIDVARPGMADRYVVPESVFLALLFGVEHAHDDLDALALPGVAGNALARLFPPQDWVFWRSEAF